MGKDLSREIVWVKDENADIPGYVQNSTNIIVVDHKGSLYCKYKDTLEQEGYKVKCLDLNHPEKGNHYNPFHYIHSIEDIEALVSAIIKSEMPIEVLVNEIIKSEPAAGPWRKWEELLLNAGFSYVYLHMPPEQRKISNIPPLIRGCSSDYVDTAPEEDNPFKKLRTQHPESHALAKFIEFEKATKIATENYCLSILISCIVRLQIFDHQLYPNVAIVTDTDDLELENIVHDKFAVFILLPEQGKEYDIMGTMLSCQASRFLS